MNRIAATTAVVAGSLALACSGTPSPSGFGDAGGGTSTGIITSSGNSSVVILPGASSSGPILTQGDSGTTQSSSGSGPCPYTSGTTDHDGDGWSPAEGDCNDCNKYINPGAYDIPGNGIDEDCDGKADDEPTGCDSSLSVATTTGSQGAQAMDICRTTTSAPALPMKTWGLISADYVLPDGTSAPTSTGQDGEGECSYTSNDLALGFGVLGPTFGNAMNTTQQGMHMLGLSTGTARQPTDPGFSDPTLGGGGGGGGGGGIYGFVKCFTSAAPTGFPGTTPACPGVSQFGKPHDGAGLRVVVRVPTNALTMAFDSNFFSHEFPDYVCSMYNDTYVVIMTPSPQGEPSTAHDNIAFDSMMNIISVNAGFLTVCDPNAVQGYACTEGPTKLAGTGFAKDDSPDDEDHASTDWLTTSVDVASLAGQEITLLFAIWDSGDSFLDSTVLVDNLHWTFATMPNQVPPAPVPPTTIPK